MYESVLSYICPVDYIKFCFRKVDSQQQEVLIAQLQTLALLGFEQKDDFLLAYAENEAVTEQDVVDNVGNLDFEVEVLPEVNWNEKWERDFEPIIIQDKVAIRAHFHEPISTVNHEIIVTPKMSFGTGHHATTQLMLEQMSRLDLSSAQVFDYGTGTGVLAIFAEMLGAIKIIANDIDPWSTENAAENIERNNCSKVDIRLGGIDVINETGFDCILANINLNVLRESMKNLFQKLKKGGQGLVLSGVLKENLEDITSIIELYSCDYQVFEKNRWLCIHINY